MHSLVIVHLPHAYHMYIKNYVLFEIELKGMHFYVMPK